MGEGCVRHKSEPTLWFFQVHGQRESSKLRLTIYTFNKQTQPLTKMFLDVEKETQVNKLVREYLNYADYPTTLSAFDVEARLKGRSILQQDSESIIESSETLNSQNQFMLPFQEGDREKFFALWDDRFPASLRETDPLYQRMEFQINIYFAIFPLHSGVNPAFAKRVTVQKSMEAFKLFLETRGADLCKTTQFLSYYALPYVPDPRSHPSFGDLFAERYVRDLEDRLRHFLGMALKAADTPRLLEFVFSRENPLEPKLKGCMNPFDLRLTTLEESA
ncbi:LisH domain-containing protein armc9, partial [Dinochytrium kinnereticum]